MDKILQKIRQPGSRWLKSYIVIIFSIAIVLLVYSLFIIKSVQKDTDQNNRRFATYFNTTIENRLKSIQDYSYTLLMDSSARKLHDYRDSEAMNSVDALSEAYEIVYGERDFIIANGMIEDIFVYYPETDQIIGRYGSFPSHIYYQTFNVNTYNLEESYRNWMQNVFSDRKTGFFTHTDLDGNHDIYYYYGISYNTNRKEERKIIIHIGGEMLGRELDNLSRNADYRFAGLMDEAGYVYAKSSDSKEYVDDAGRFCFENNSDAVKYSVGSSLWALSFVAIQDYGSAYTLVKTISIILILGMVLSLIVGLIVSVYYAGRSKKAMEGIVSRFGKAEETGINQDEFEYVSGQIDELLEKNRYAIAAAERQNKIIGYSFLRDILYRQTCSEKDMEQLSASYGIEMENELFALAVVTADKADAKVVHSDLRETAFDIISSFEEDKFLIFWTMIADDMQVFMCNYDSVTKSPQTTMIEFARNIKNRLGDGYEIRLSNVLSTSSEINAEWHYMLRNTFPEMEVSSRKLIENAGLQALKEFTDAIDNGNLTDAIKQIPELNRKFISCPNENLTICRKYTLISRLYEAFPNEGQRQLIDVLLDDVTGDEWSYKLEEIVKSLDRDINQKLDMRQVAEMAHDIIDQEYDNPQLGLHMIADRIGVSQSYLSRLFKQKYGIGVIKYLNYVRIEQAKRLMVTGTDNLQVIAMNVGFLSDVTLIRVFKKYENTTPGNYRN